jgi:hypothetical protein
MIQRLTKIRIIEISNLSTYPVLPLISDPMVMKTLKADPRSRMIAEPQIVSDLIRHPSSAI